LHGASLNVEASLQNGAFPSMFGLQRQACIKERPAPSGWRI
jgi:hypothetical protein